MIEAGLTQVRVLPGRLAAEDADHLAPEAAKGVLAELAARVMRQPTEDPLCDLQGLIPVDKQGLPIERFRHTNTMASRQESRSDTCRSVRPHPIRLLTLDDEGNSRQDPATNRGGAMGIDLTGGLADGREFVFPAQPDDPEMRESVNAWIWDRGADVGMPRIGIEAVADQWQTHDVQVNIALAGGRVLNIFEAGKVHDPRGADGEARILGAGPLSFELVEPFRHWKMRLDGLAFERTVEDQMAAKPPAGKPSVPVDIEIDIVSAVPPWENGEMLAEAKRVLEEQDEGALMGGPRFEQLSRAAGTARIGDREYAIDGGALRVRRQGIRRLGTFRGHAWQSALFPSGRGFGYIVYPPHEDGHPTYNEGYLFEGDGALIPAWVVDAPWLRRLQPKGEDVSVVLETANGTTRIEAESVLSTYHVMAGVGSSAAYPILQQAIARYSWEGETANGMMERSIPADQLSA
jgi:hypothetical protein